MAKDKAQQVKDAWTNDDYVVMQVEAMKKSERWKAHRARVNRFDQLYAGNLLGLTPEENTLTNEPYVENKVKNATHDIKRLAREARGVPVFTKEGEDVKSADRAKMRSVIAQTLWEEGGGADFEGKLYLDLIAAGFCAVACYVDRDASDYPLALHLNPRMAYPTVANGRLISLLYVETMKERIAASLFPTLGLDPDPAKTETVDVVMFFDKETSTQSVIKRTTSGSRVGTVSTWPHNLGIVPVAFRAIDSADDAYHGLLDGLGGPLKARNRAARLMIDYLEDMVHAPWEERGIENGPSMGNLPGPATSYVHRDDVDNTFVRRTQPAAPAGAVFGLLNYLDAQESSEGFQPPSRIGQVRQSIASGSFIASTQGSLSSVVLELQDYVAKLRRDYDKIAMKADEKHLDFEKPLIRSVGQRKVYVPSKDINGWYYHKIAFGAAAGLDRAQADSRVLQHLGAGLIDEEIARDQIDYIENDTNVQDDVDRMQLRKVMFQKLIQDPNVQFSDLAEIDQQMAAGKSRHQALEAVLPKLIERAKAAEAAAAPPAPGGQEGTPIPGGQAPGATQLGLEMAPQGGLPQGVGQRGLSQFQPSVGPEAITSL